MFDAVGFTGTRKGMARPQRHAFASWLAALPPAVFHHGDCIGSDEEAHDIAQAEGWTIEAHPGSGWASYRMVAHCGGVDVRHPPKPYLERNIDIATVASVLAATPEGPEVARSGTWATVRVARRLGRPVVIFWPDGTVTTERMPSVAEGGYVFDIPSPST